MGNVFNGWQGILITIAPASHLLCFAQSWCVLSYAVQSVYNCTEIVIICNKCFPFGRKMANIDQEEKVFLPFFYQSKWQFWLFCLVYLFRRYVKELNACEQIQNFFLEECCKRRRQENSKNIGSRFIYNHWHICIISKSKDWTMDALHAKPVLYYDAIGIPFCIPLFRQLHRKFEQPGMHRKLLSLEQRGFGLGSYFGSSVLSFSMAERWTMTTFESI